MPDLGDRINRAWRAWVRKNIDARALRRELQAIDFDDEIAEPLYIYVVVVVDHGRPSIESVEGPMDPQYFQGLSSLDGRARLVGAIPVHRSLSKRELLAFDLAEDTQFWELVEEP